MIIKSFTIHHYKTYCFVLRKQFNKNIILLYYIIHFFCSAIKTIINQNINYKLNQLPHVEIF